MYIILVTYRLPIDFFDVKALLANLLHHPPIPLLLTIKFHSDLDTNYNAHFSREPR